MGGEGSKEKKKFNKNTCKMVAFKGMHGWSRTSVWSNGEGENARQEEWDERVLGGSRGVPKY